MASLDEQLRELVAEVGGLDAGFDAAANLYLDLAIPSVKAMQLLMELETRYDVAIPDDQFVEAVSLDALATMMRRLLDTK